MAKTQTHPGGPVATTLNYNCPETPYDYYPGTAAAYTMPWDSVSATINDARGREDDFGLDKAGFGFVKHGSKCVDGLLASKEKEWVEAEYYPEIAELLKNVTNATLVLPIDHLARLSAFDPVKSWADSQGPESTARVPAGQRVPARFVHVDQSYTGAELWMRQNLDVLASKHSSTNKFDAEKLSKTRWAIVNVWRPLNEGRVGRDPLSVCDGRTVLDEDLREVVGRLRGPKGDGKVVGGADGGEKRAFEVSRSGGDLPFWFLNRPEAAGGEVNGHAEGRQHEWYYWSGMTRDEVMLIKCFDTKMDRRCRRAPHSAFEDARFLGEGEEVRKSVEVRCLVFWEDESAA